MIIVITGASKGLGKSFAEIFAEQNTLLLCARNEVVLKQTATQLQQQYPSANIHYKKTDMRNKQEVIAFANWCNSFGTTDILINNAGKFVAGSICTEDDTTLEMMMETNVYSAYYLTKLLVPKMKENKKGHIFNICSIASLQAYSNGGSYSISKFALLGFSKNLREELKPYGIKVTAVMPGAVYTDSWSGTGVSEERIMEVKDIAKMVEAASQLSFNACVEEIVIRPQLGDI